MINNTISYYDIESNWDNFTLTPVIEDKINHILDMMPDDIMTVLDVGCGNGVITNQLSIHYNVVGLDQSKPALKHVQTPKIQAFVEDLPINENSVDLCLCSEVLEHLPSTVLQKTVLELNRICPKYIFITVPNGEMLRKNYLKCPNCGCEFSASHHLHTFTKEKLDYLFPDYRMISYREIGPGWRRYQRHLLWIRQRIGNGWFKIPNDRTVMCPECENISFPKFHWNPIIFFCDGLNRLISPRRPYWIAMVFKKQ